MRKLNCRPGDLAITVEAFNPINIGSIVRVLHKHHNQSALSVEPDDFLWYVEASHYLTYSRGLKFTRRKRGAAPDSYLRPIRGNGVSWLGGISETAVPVLKYVVKISHKGLLFGSYSDYQRELSNKVLDLRDREKLTFNGVAEKLILEGYRSPRGFDLGPESVFSIYKKRKIRDARLLSPPTIEVLRLDVKE
jgi:hypothetical protein